MGIWSSMIEGTKSLWESGPNQAASGYLKGTASFMGKQLAAVPEALQALGEPKTRKIIKATGYMTLHMVPLIAVNYLNNWLQAIGQIEDEDQRTYAYTTIMPAVLYIINIGVAGYTLRQGVGLAIETFVIDTIAPSALVPKTQMGTSPCTKECNSLSTQFRGEATAALTYQINMLVLAKIPRLTPYVGEWLSQLLEIYFTGTFITNSALSRRCANHRTVDSKIALSFGLSNFLLTHFVDWLFKQSIGLPPSLVRRAIHHLALLWIITVAARMEIPYKSAKSSIYHDPFIILEKTSNTFSHIMVKGLEKHLPKMIKPEPGDIPIITLPMVLRFLSGILEKGTETTLNDKANRTWFEFCARIMRPEILQSSEKTVNNDVIKIFWLDIREFMLDIIRIMLKAGVTIKQITTSTIPVLDKKVEAALIKCAKYEWGIPEKLGKILIKLSHEEDFWVFIRQLKKWLEVHYKGDIKELILATENDMNLLQTTKELMIPKDTRSIVLTEGLRNRPDKMKERTVDPLELKLRQEKDKNDAATSSLQACSIFKSDGNLSKKKPNSITYVIS